MEEQPWELGCGFVQVRAIFLLFNQPVWGDAGPAPGGLLLASWPEALGMLSADHSWLKTPWFLLKSPLWHHPISKGKEKDGFS